MKENYLSSKRWKRIKRWADLFFFSRWILYSVVAYYLEILLNSWECMNMHCWVLKITLIAMFAIWTFLLVGHSFGRAKLTTPSQKRIKASINSEIKREWVIGFFLYINVQLGFMKFIEA